MRAVASGVHSFVSGLYTSGTSAMQAGQGVAPEVTTTRPLPRGGAVGFHRRCALSGAPGCQVSVTGSKMFVKAAPRTELSLSWPPAIRIRPSASCECPEPNRLSMVGTGPSEPVVGLYSVADDPPMPSPAYIRTLPVRSMTMLTAVRPSSKGADHEPTMEGSLTLKTV